MKPEKQRKITQEAEGDVLIVASYLGEIEIEKKFRLLCNKIMQKESAEDIEANYDVVSFVATSALRPLTFENASERKRS